MALAFLCCNDQCRPICALTVRCKAVVQNLTRSVG
jgi:hypothetical protein